MKEAAKDFLAALRTNAKYWANIAKQQDLSYDELTESMTFSILSYLDGCGMDNTILLFRTDDNGNLAECINDEDMLHENWYK